MTVPHLSKIATAGSLVFSSGQLAFDAGGKLVGDDIATQTAQVLANIDAALASAGCKRGDIVKTTIWLTRAADFAGFNTAYAAFFGEHKPARSTTVCELVIPGALIEIEAIAQQGNTPR